MKVLLIGNSGTGKSTLARVLAARTGWPLLALDRLWHADDYSSAAKTRLAEAQRQFMATHDDWLIDGNYKGTLPLRLAQADLVLWCQAPRLVCEARVMQRSWAFHRDPAARPDMAPTFREHLDRDYWEFLKYVWHYDDAAIRAMVAGHIVIPVRNGVEKAVVVRALSQR
ncbi:AAA family ATPase [Lacticaseibacillus mingshuiensis]|uniref:AAA family ATPase n=1 Tax=Lacticaseibacillus mingshuiensis TaxID=2799574 RepID=A0ABW4CHX9_9LACO|nr:AAA family ATPase [Lacticaseibacillus mingshuiensis]